LNQNTFRRVLRVLLWANDYASPFPLPLLLAVLAAVAVAGTVFWYS
jgi:hypothetical protein